MSGVAPARSKQYFPSSSGAPLAGGKIDVYYAGTTDRANTYQDKDLTTLNTNPVILNARGECTIWLNPAYTYKFVVKDASDVVLYTEDDVLGSGGDGESWVVNVKDFGAIGDGTNHQLSERYSTLSAAQAVYSFVTALTQSIDWAAFQAAHNSLSDPSAGSSPGSVGGIIVVPPGSYYLSDTWKISKRCWIMGAHSGDQSGTAASLLNFPADVTGIRTYSFINSPTGNAADRTRISGLNVNATAKNATGHGIHVNCVIYIEDCIVRGFQQHGILIETNFASIGIADGWNVRRTKIASNSGDGLRVTGNDAQVGCAELVDCSSNSGYDFFDNAFYANLYLSCHSNGTGTKSYYCRNGAGQGSTYIGCYVEYGQVGTNPDFDGNVTVIGGSLAQVANTANVIYASTTGLTLNPVTRLVFQKAGVEVGRVESTGQITGFKGISLTGTTATNTVESPTAGGSILMGTTADAAAHTKIRFSNSNGVVGTIQTSGSNTSYNTSSDYRLKYDLQPMVNGLAKIMQLKPQVGKWRADDSPFQGFVAHELQEVFPEAVSGKKDEMEEVQVEVMDADGKVVRDAEDNPVTETKIVQKYQGVDVSFIVPSLVAAVQEQQALIAALRSEFDAYKATHP